MQIWLNFFFLINNFGSIWPFLFRNPKYQICLKAQAGNFIMNLNKKTLIGTSNTNSKSQAWIGPLWSPHIFEIEWAKIIMLPYSRQDWGHRGHDCMVVKFTTTYAIKRKPLEKTTDLLQGTDNFYHIINPLHSHRNEIRTHNFCGDRDALIA